ncbi:uncharacterized protein CLUP02_14948 [Colletotrichum lupini]|uniref:Uncharacterized protein n=1 Tax=Colletotrichum lupini TaxID=145971 RepID=A0A9Q8T5S1_9PEZI|nr:uncharacterized protein CLUP02_14948 [Colletotrichum lupini]UQC89418.1 hypothetical protein CLUP02_14948 [Colletotrichum lupini]
METRKRGILRNPACRSIVHTVDELDLSPTHRKPLEMFLHFVAGHAGLQDHESAFTFHANKSWEPHLTWSSGQRSRAQTYCKCIGPAIELLHVAFIDVDKKRFTNRHREALQDNPITSDSFYSFPDQAACNSEDENIKAVIGRMLDKSVSVKRDIHCISRFPRQTSATLITTGPFALLFQDVFARHCSTQLDPPVFQVTRYEEGPNTWDPTGMRPINQFLGMGRFNTEDPIFGPKTWVRRIARLNGRLLMDALLHSADPSFRLLSFQEPNWRFLKDSLPSIELREKPSSGTVCFLDRFLRRKSRFSKVHI